MCNIQCCTLYISYSIQWYSNRDILGDPHRSTGASRHAVHKIHPTTGGGEEFVRIPARAALFSVFSFPLPTGRLPCTQIHLPTLPLPTTHVFAFQRDVSLNARIAPGLTTLPEGEPVLSGPTAQCRDNGTLHALREEERGKRSDIREPLRNSRRIGCDYHSTRSTRFLPVFSP